MKVKQTKLTKKQIIETLDSLYTAAGTVRGRDAMKRFLRDLLTPSERIMLGRRIVIARRLLAGEGYDAIRTDMGVGRSTIAKVHRWLSDQLPGYEEAIAGMKHEFDKRKIKYERRKDFANLKRKYPLHFLLFPWSKGFKPKGW
jgi:uncharacterized protein YerC